MRLSICFRKGDDNSHYAIHARGDTGMHASHGTHSSEIMTSRLCVRVLAQLIFNTVQFSPLVRRHPRVHPAAGHSCRPALSSSSLMQVLMSGHSRFLQGNSVSVKHGLAPSRI